MKNNYLSFFLILFIFCANAQELFLIEETDSIQLFETHLSNTSESNVFPAFYKEGLIYVSNYKSNDHKLYYSDLQLPSLKISLGSKFNFGAATVFENEIYFTGNSKKMDKYGYNNSTIYKGIFEDLKVSKIKKLEFCDYNYSYSDPSISTDGKQLLVVSSERDRFHIIEFVRNDIGQWEKQSVVFISHPHFDIINPTIYDENTVYFSTNIYNGKIIGVKYSNDEKGEVVVEEVKREEGDFNIYKIERTNGNWGIPVKAHEFNTEYDELGVLFDSDKSGYLTTFRYNSNDNIYYFILK
ncbi:MAG: hypothetical protein IZT56_01360 [Bacteroidetes bacterium]|nr:hypothetical protein [Bacteroidota bacterium]